MAGSFCFRWKLCLYCIANFSKMQEKYPDFRPENFPNADEHSKNTITLPLFPDMTQEQAELVIDAVKSVGEKYHVR